MKKKELPRLTLHRETIQRLDRQTLSEVRGDGDDPPPSSQAACCPASVAPC